MAKKVTFGLGVAPSQLATRTLTITRMPDADNDAYNPVYGPTDQGVVDNATVELADNQIFQAKLVDALDTGEESAPDILNFQTGTLQFPGPKSGDRLSILFMEDMSSSSSSSLSSSSVSSASSISTSSISTSSSSISTSSSSSSSISTSSASSSSSVSSSSSSISTSSSSLSS